MGSTALAATKQQASSSSSSSPPKFGRGGKKIEAAVEEPPTFFEMLAEDPDRDGDGRTETDEFYRARAKGLVPVDPEDVKAAMTCRTT